MSAQVLEVGITRQLSWTILLLLLFWRGINLSRICLLLMTLALSGEYR